jgi:hypothetical protein
MVFPTTSAKRFVVIGLRTIGLHMAEAVASLAVGWLVGIRGSPQMPDKPPDQPLPPSVSDSFHMPLSLGLRPSLFREFCPELFGASEPAIPS